MHRLPELGLVSNVIGESIDEQFGLLSSSPFSKSTHRSGRQLESTILLKTMFLWACLKKVDF
ncbi:MAG: hypothetical protein ACI9UH_000055 [Gammaproteobacteria bacterium]|jgi:hypothetical protein